MRGQLASRWQQVARPQATIEYRPPQLAVDFAAQIRAAEETDVNLHQVNATSEIGLIQGSTNWL
jgi:hypothetical protein